MLHFKFSVDGLYENALLPALRQNALRSDDEQGLAAVRSHDDGWGRNFRYGRGYLSNTYLGVLSWSAVSRVAAAASAETATDSAYGLLTPFVVQRLSRHPTFAHCFI